jgi:putative Holliday junction resolvase
MASSESAAEISDFPREGRLLGLDYGQRRIGVAVSTPEQTIASALLVIHRANEDADREQLRKLVAENRIVGLVVGLPVLLSGEEGESARRAREFGTWAATATGLPVRFWDERFSSSFADDVLREAGLKKQKAKDRRDMLAAQSFLQSYLDSRRGDAIDSAD